MIHFTRRWYSYDIYNHHEIWSWMKSICRSSARETNKYVQRLAADIASWNSILRLRSREFWCAAPAHIRLLFDRIDRFSLHCRWPFVRSLNQGSLVFKSEKISAQRTLVDTIVNTGGNSCKKFKPPDGLGAESFLLPCLHPLCFPLRACASAHG